MTQTTIYPLKDRAAAFCRGFKTFHPLVEVAKEGLTRKGLDPQLKRIYEERVASAQVSPQERVEQMKEKLFNAKVFFGVSCLIESIALTIPRDQNDGQTLSTYLSLMGGIAAAIWLGFMRYLDNSLNKPFYSLKPVATGLGGIVSTALTVSMLNSLFTGMKSLASDGINPFMMFTSGRLVLASVVAGVLTATSVTCIRSFLKTRLSDLDGKPEANL